MIRREQAVELTECYKLFFSLLQLTDQEIPILKETYNFTLSQVG